MAEFKRLSDVEVVAEPTESANVLIEENGVIKKAPNTTVGVQANWTETDESSLAFIKNKPHKELMYEWNFDYYSEVYEVSENVDDDLSWLTEKHDDIGWEITITTYSKYYQDDNQFINYNLTSTMFATDTSYYTVFHDNQEMNTYVGGNSPEDFRNNWTIDYHSPECEVYVYNQAHFDPNNDWAYTWITTGGNFHLSTYNTPFKSVKIYKVIR